MTGDFDPLPAILLEAKMPGAIGAPSELLTAIAATENPLAALSDHDQANDLFAALDCEFGFIRFAKNARKAPGPAEQARWASLVRWLIQELNQWRRADDPSSHKLAAIFVVAQTVDWNNDLWRYMPAGIGSNTDLTQRLRELISSFAIVFNAPAGATEPIWEREALDRFILADATGDWVAIANGLRAFERQLFPNTIQTQASRCLYFCGVDYLVGSLSNLRQTIVAIQIASTLSVEQRLNLAVKSDNPHVQFGCVHQTLTSWPVPNELPANEQQLLTGLLVKVAGDEPRWTAWMRAFNTYPVRYSALQIPLGHALAEGPESGIDAYVSSISLFPKPSNSGQPDHGRLNVAACLRAFRARATPDRRASLWKRAHQRWSAWRFDQANQDTHLFAISWSELDYAVVGFAYECLDNAERQKAIDTVRDKLQLLDERWHVSITAVVTAWNRLLSELQPYAHASLAVVDDEDWLPQRKTYLPFDPTTNEYLVMKYRLF